MRISDRVRIALESSAPDDELRVWMWVEFVHGGEVDIVEAAAQFGGAIVGKAARAGRLSIAGGKVSASSLSTSRSEVKRAPIRQAREEEPEDAVEVPKDPLAGTRFEKLEGRERLEMAFSSPRAKGSKIVREEAAGWAWRRYNTARKEKTGKRLPESQKGRSKAHMMELAKFVLTEGIKLDEFLEFAYKRTRWQKVAFPATTTIGGPWIQEEWHNDTDRGVPGHAGHSYSVAEEGLRKRLSKAFPDSKIIGGLSEDDLAFIEEEAVVLNDRPEHYTPDPELDEFVRWVADHKEE